MKHSTATFLPFLFVTVVLSGCATLFSGTSDDITFESEPEGAAIMIDGIKRGETPATINVSRPMLFTGGKYVTLEMDGYEDRRIKLQQDFTTVSILNLTNGIAWGIDALSGAMMNYSVRSYNLELERGEEAHLLEELRRDEEGRYVVPDVEKSISVTDEENGLQFIFSKDGKEQ